MMHLPRYFFKNNKYNKNNAHQRNNKKQHKQLKQPFLIMNADAN